MTTQITLQEIQDLAQMSGLQLDNSEIDSLKSDIDRIIDYIKQLGDLDTSGIEPTYQVTGLENIWREDVIEDSNVSRENLLDLAPDTHLSQIKVPKVL